MEAEQKNITPVNNRDFVALIILFITPLLFFWKVIFLDYDLYYDDIKYFFYHIRCLLYRMGREHQLFLWNPYEFSGMDCTGDLPKGMYYPLNFLFYFVTTNSAVTIYVVTHFIIQNICMYLFLRSRKMSEYASVCGALIFTFGSITVLHICSLNYLGTQCWFPLLLYLLERFHSSFRYDLAAFAGIVMALMFLSGMPQMFYYVILFLGFYVIFKCIVLVRQRDVRGPGLLCANIIVMLIIFLGLSAIQLIPFLQLSSNTFRAGGTSFEFSNSFHLSLRMLKTLIVPFFYGNPYWNNYTGDWNFFDGVHYFGIFSLFLSLIGVIYSKDRLFLMMLALLSLVIALGKDFMLFTLLFKYIPFFSCFRAHCRILVFVNFTIAVFAASGCDFLGEGKSRLTGRCAAYFAFAMFFFLAIALFTENQLNYGQMMEALWATILIIISAGVIYVFSRIVIKRNVMIIVSIPLIIIDLWSFGARYVQKTPRELMLQVPAPYAQLPDNKELFRICTNTDMRIDDTLIPQSIRYGYANAQGFDSLPNRDYVSFLFYNETHMLPTGIFIDRLRITSYAFLITHYPSSILSLLNVKYFFVYDESSKRIRIQENKKFLPRFFIVENFSVEEEKEKVLEYLEQDNIDLRKTVFLDKEPADEDIEFIKTHGNGEIPTTDQVIVIEGDSPNKISLIVRAKRPGALFFSEIYYPGWKATIDNVPVEILRANVIFRSILIPAGSHLVNMWYEPESFVLGRAITFFTLGILLMWGIVRLIQKLNRHFRRGRNPEPRIKAFPSCRGA